ncbi:MAG: RdgB/HAM1 family non-canonical purine NTP pyrophosphatase [Clostridia bacterium]|nr:RdgB/HAM1 family non-canonical purine NTP pyrophosphatase [Clostridia bacterium]
MKIVLASKNKHKIGELQTLMRQYISDVEILSLDDIGFDGEIEEDGVNFEQNAFIKARAVASKGYIGLGDDSGLCVRALGGAPGIYSAKYAGEHGNDRANNEKLLCDLADKSDRYAEFVCTIACVFPDGRECCVSGRVSGRIVDEYRGDGGFGYDPIFYYEPFGKTLAQLSADEKNSVSHRGRAIELLAAELKKII